MYTKAYVVYKYGFSWYFTQRTTTNHYIRIFWYLGRLFTTADDSWKCREYIDASMPIVIELGRPQDLKSDVRFSYDQTM